jgi:SAM-dependent methyltransferase
MASDLLISGAFDAAWYLSRYPDAQGSSEAALDHYLTSSSAEGRFPNPIFDSRWYLAKYADVREAGTNPLLHYLQDGAREGREPNAWFNTAFYLGQVHDESASANAMLHYLKAGGAAGLKTSPSLDLVSYASGYPDLKQKKVTPLAHFLHDPDVVTEGWLSPCTGSWVAGWACRRIGPAVKLTVLVNGVSVGEVTPWISRPDVEKITGLPGKGYFFSFPRRLSSGDQVRIVDENLVDLHGSPTIYQIPSLNTLPGFLEARAAIADMYLKGSGLEIGAFTQPTDLPPDRQIEYFDRFPAEILRTHYDESWGRPLVEPKYHGNAESLDGVEPGKTFDFLIANHVIEHLEDPIRFLKEIARVLNPGGRALLVAPNKRFTFDQYREMTRFDHLVDDHLGGAKRNRRPHFIEWSATVDGVTGEAGALRAAQLEAEDFSIHFHVWDENTFLEFLMTAIRKFYLPFHLLFTLSANTEISVVLERE